MRKNNIFLLTSAFVLLFSGCLKEEELEGSKPVTLEPMTFHASMESGADTKTVIEGNVGDDVRYLKWLPADRISVYNTQTRKFETFVNVNEETSATAVFEGVNSVQDVYYAVYPYSELHSYAEGDKIMTVDLPAVQKYSEGSFGMDANPMVALAGKGEKFFFQNLCGVLVINITGEASVKSLSVTLFDESGNPAAVSGKHTVSMDYIESPTLASTEESKKTVTLDCGEGVALNTSEPTPFHVVLPAGTYSGIMVSVFTTDGRIMVKQGKNSLRIRRSRVTSAGSFIHESVGVDVDLSDRGTSNCYIISGSGVYSFDANVIGNGESGFVEDAGFHTDSPIINPSIVELLWEDKPGVVQSVGYNDGKVLFYSLGTEGNALIAAKDESGDIVWSWHIWSTDLPENQVYVNSFGEYTLMDRNLGAISDTGETEEEWAESVGMLYQWGRKDPLYKEIYSEADIYKIEETIKYPAHHSTLHGWNYQKHWEENHNDELWNPKQKTIYDPCPVGYMVADINAYYGLSVDGDNDFGYYAYVNESSNSWFPITPMIYCNGSYEDAGSDVIGSKVIIWSSSITSFNSFYRLQIDNGESTNGYDNAAMTSPVRCMKDEDYVDISLPQVQISGFEGISLSSANVVVEIQSEGISEITEKGIIWGTAEDLSGGIKIKCGSGADEYVVELTELDNATKYYVRPYAVNSRGETLGSVKSFTTKYSDSEVDLSSEGTANSYMVGTLGMYSFDCTVKGNSNESVGVPSSVQVLWETDNTSVPVSSGYIVSEVNLIEGGRVVFEASGNPGNALIAVKDADETILWSWHIWSTDIPKDQVYKNQTDSYIVMDRNLGALRSDRGKEDQWKESQGLLYQWGRKDPFADGYIVKHNAGMSVEESVMMPTSYYTGWSPRSGSWSAEKTIHDPCPPGYRVPDLSVLEGFTATGNDTYDIDQINVRGNFDFGWNFIIDDAGNTAWYPATYHMGAMGIYEHHTDIGYIWTTDGNLFEYRCNSNEIYVMIGKNTGKYQGFSVRCMKE